MTRRDQDQCATILRMSIYIIREDHTPFPYLIPHIDRFQSRIHIDRRTSRSSEPTFPRDPFPWIWRFRICPVDRSSPCRGIDSVHRDRIDRSIYFELSSWRIYPSRNPERISNWSLTCAIHVRDTRESTSHSRSVDQSAKHLRIPVSERFLSRVWRWPKEPECNPLWCGDKEEIHVLTFNL